MSYISLWMSALKQPKETLASEKKNADLSEGAKHLAIGFGVAGLLMGLVIALFASVFALIPGAGLLAGLGFLAIIAAPIGLIIFGIISSLIATGVVHVVAKALGGTGTFEQQFYLGAIWMAPIMLLSLVLNIIPILGALVALLLNLYGLYLFVLTLKEVHAFDTTKAIIVLVVLFVVYIILAFVFGAVLIGLLGAAAGARAY